MSEEKLLRVRVDGIETGPGAHGTVRVGLGRTVDDNRRVVFLGGTRMMADIAHALRSGEPIVATVPTWALLHASNPEETA